MFIHEPSKIISNSTGVCMFLWEVLVCHIASQGYYAEEGPEEELPFFYGVESPLLEFVTSSV